MEEHIDKVPSRNIGRRYDKIADNDERINRLRYILTNTTPLSEAAIILNCSKSTLEGDLKILERAYRLSYTGKYSLKKDVEIKSINKKNERDCRTKRNNCCKN